MSKFKSIVEKLDFLKSKFADETEVIATATATDTEEVATKFEEIPLMDESIIAFDGGLEVGTAIFIVTEDGEQVPATEGTLQLGGELEGVSIVLDAEGIVLELVDERTEGEDAPEEEVEEEMSSEKVEAIIDNKMSDIETPLNAIVNGIESILSRNAELQGELNELKESFKAFKNEPTTEKEESKFSTANDKDRRTRYFTNMLKK
jgi:uncharacterized protein YeeX (DUF496 family)